MPILSSDGPEPHDEEHPAFNKGYRRARGVAPAPPGAPKPEDTLNGKAELAAAFTAGRRAGLLAAAQVCDDTVDRYEQRKQLFDDSEKQWPDICGKVAAAHCRDAIRALLAREPDAVP